MKFTKITSTVLMSATFLSALAAPVATFAATPNDDAEANGGTALVQTDTTDGAISFGDTSDNGNSGYLRLQMVPHILDFGNHAKFDSAKPTFDATGDNVGNSGNKTHASYDMSESNKTAVLNNKIAGLEDVQGTTWVTVVDKQTTNPTLATGEDGATAGTAGDWKLSVKADSPLTSNSDKQIAGANLVFENTKYGQDTTDVIGLTGQDQDKDFAASASTAAVKDINGTVSLALDNTDEKEVATAATGEGEGADVFGWNPTDVRLMLNGTDNVDNGEYHTALTWSLSSTI